MKILHFADAHIDMANYGRHDPETGLPLRVLDFLKSLDAIVEAAVSEKVDLVIFAGDAYKDRSPAPTFQREWGKRIIRLSKAGIRTLLLVGNHDLSPALGRANAIQEFETLDIPHVTVLSKPQFLSSGELGLPVQVIAIPWVARSGLLAATDASAADMPEVFSNIEERLTELVDGWLADADPALPVILTAHASVQGAKFGSERTVMLGADMVLPGSLVKDGRLDYVALGHIHKPQDLNENAHPPVIYPGSIERVDFGEAGDEKFFIIAEVERGRTRVEWRKLANVRPFIDRQVALESPEDVNTALQSALPPQEELAGAIVRLTVDYVREWDELIDEASLRRYAEEAFEFHLIKRPRIESRIRLPGDQTVSSLSPLELLDQYWRAVKADEAEALQKLAKEIIEEE
ncbi:MAG TPA: exonuclease SbcCD subunit D [Anaerolineales bacterium]|nr:exonuclease SbcCD subunit D [Anaerolineales bacterium]